MCKTKKIRLRSEHFARLMQPRYTYQFFPYTTWQGNSRGYAFRYDLCIHMKIPIDAFSDARDGHYKNDFFENREILVFLGRGNESEHYPWHKEPPIVRPV